MTLIPIETPEDFSLAQQFIIPHEETCVSLASLVRRKSDKLIFITSSEKPVVSIRSSDYSTTDTTGILGILNLDSTIYHCIPDPALIDENELSENLHYLIKKQIRCISGESAATDFLISVINKLTNDSSLITPLKQIYYYKMMKWSNTAVVSTGSTTLSGGEEIIRCTEHDMETLHPLQKDYMKEEVAVPGRPITDAEVAIALRQILKNQLCFALTVDGDIVAKANTNAIGINKVQIGGVYTHPLYRRNGYAGALVQALCNRAIRSGKEPVLFVKEKNKPAFALYQKIGFAECGRYAIAYY